MKKIAVTLFTLALSASLASAYTLKDTYKQFNYGDGNSYWWFHTPTAVKLTYKLTQNAPAPDNDVYAMFFEGSIKAPGVMNDLGFTYVDVSTHGNYIKTITTTPDHGYEVYYDFSDKSILDPTGAPAVTPTSYYNWTPSLSQPTWSADENTVWFSADPYGPQSDIKLQVTMTGTPLPALPIALGLTSLLSTPIFFRRRK